MSKEKVLGELAAQVRRLSALSALISQAVADRVGLSSTDLECLDLIALGDGPVTPTHLMQATGLTSGAITGVVDRLEAAGFVRREPDAHDRRKVVLRADPARLAEVAGYYASLQKAMLALWSSFTQAELQMVLDFTRRSCDLSTRELEAIQALPKMARGGSKRAAGRPAAPSRRR